MAGLFLILTEAGNGYFMGYRKLLFNRFNYRGI
jgi:hypothetical protein